VQHYEIVISVPVTCTLNEADNVLVYTCMCVCVCSRKELKTTDQKLT